MRFDNLLEKTTTTIKSTSCTIADKYSLHVRKRAMKEVSKKLKKIGKTPSQIEKDNYEVMVNDASKDIQSTYNKRIAQVGLSLLGLDLIFGI